MTENTPFSDEWKKMQKTFLDKLGSNLGSNYVHPSNPTTEEGSAVYEDNAFRHQQSPFLTQWLTDMDDSWQNNKDVTSTDIDSLYEKISSSSRFFINFTESVSATIQGEIQGEKKQDLFENIQNSLQYNSQDKFKEEISGYLENPASTLSHFDTTLFDKIANVVDMKTLWNLPPDFIHNQHNAINALSGLLKDAANNPEFAESVKTYFIALQKYQFVLINLFKTSALQAVDKLKLNLDQLNSPKHIMNVCLEILEANYMMLISEDSYSKAYADVVNSWILVLNKSNKTLTEFSTAGMTVAEVNINAVNADEDKVDVDKVNGQTHAK